MGCEWHPIRLTGNRIDCWDESKLKKSSYIIVTAEKVSMYAHLITVGSSANIISRHLFKLLVESCCTTVSIDVAFNIKGLRVASSHRELFNIFIGPSPASFV